MFSRRSKCHHYRLESRGTILRWWWWLSQENALHVQASSLLTFCLTLRKLVRASKSRKSLGIQAWPESCLPTRGDTDACEKDPVGHRQISCYLKSLCPAYSLETYSLCLPHIPHLWADFNAVKTITNQSFFSAQGLLKIWGKMLLVLSKKLSLWKHRGLSEILCLQGKPKLLFIDLGVYCYKKAGR